MYMQTPQIGVSSKGAYIMKVSLPSYIRKLSVSQKKRQKVISKDEKVTYDRAELDQIWAQPAK